MKGFRVFLKEKQYTMAGMDRPGFGLFTVLLKKSIPIDKDIQKLLSPEKFDQYYHVTSLEGLKQVLKIQGQKKSISVSIQKPNGDVIRQGITRFKGLAVVLDGDPLISLNKDLFSHPDSSGRRWIANENIWNSKDVELDLADITEKVISKMKKSLSSMLKKYSNRFNDFRNRFLDYMGDPRTNKTHWEIPAQMEFNSMILNFSKGGSSPVMVDITHGKALYNFLRLMEYNHYATPEDKKIIKEFNKILGMGTTYYIDLVKDYIRNNKDTLSKIHQDFAEFLGSPQKQQGSYGNIGSLDETLLNNIKVKSVLIDEVETYRFFDAIKIIIDKYNDGSLTPLEINLFEEQNRTFISMTNFLNTNKISWTTIDETGGEPVSILVTKQFLKLNMDKLKEIKKSFKDMNI
jgi:hypothetical protein